MCDRIAMSGGMRNAACLISSSAKCYKQARNLKEKFPSPSVSADRCCAKKSCRVQSPTLKREVFLASLVFGVQSVSLCIITNITFGYCLHVPDRHILQK